MKGGLEPSDSVFPIAAKGRTSHSRASSASPSVRSFNSSTTEFEEELGMQEYDKKSSSVSDSTIELSRRDCIMGLFCIGKTRRRVVARINANDAVDNGYLANGRGSPWIITVYVLSTEKDDATHFVRKEAQCTIDTGNLQGDFVSKDFLVNHLGHTDSTFLPLTESEMIGGISASGDKLIPEGAVNLTWYHDESTRVFRDERFLISSNPRCDLIIGARSIEKHNLLSPPNLMVTQFNLNIDMNLMNLDGERAKYASDLTGLVGKKAKANKAKVKDESEIKKLEGEISYTNKCIEVADLHIKRYEAKTRKQPIEKFDLQLEAAHLDVRLHEAEHSIPRDEKKIEDLKNSLDEAIANLPKEGAGESSSTSVPAVLGSTSTSANAGGASSNFFWRRKNTGPN